MKDIYGMKKSWGLKLVRLSSNLAMKKAGEETFSFNWNK